VFHSEERFPVCASKKERRDPLGAGGTLGSPFGVWGFLAPSEGERKTLPDSGVSRFASLGAAQSPPRVPRSDLKPLALGAGGPG